MDEQGSRCRRQTRTRSGSRFGGGPTPLFASAAAPRAVEHAPRMACPPFRSRTRPAHRPICGRGVRFFGGLPSERSFRRRVEARLFGNSERGVAFDHGRTWPCGRTAHFDGVRRARSIGRWESQSGPGSDRSKMAVSFSGFETSSSARLAHLPHRTGGSGHSWRAGNCVPACRMAPFHRMGSPVPALLLQSCHQTAGAACHPCRPVECNPPASSARVGSSPSSPCTDR